MAIWKESTVPNKEAPIMNSEPAVKREPDYPADVAPSTARRPAPREMKESVISAEITITGKIDGAGHVRIAGRFEGDVHIQGDLTVASGSRMRGRVEFGWGDESPSKSSLTLASRQAK
jgi:hypothetical protein